MFQQKRATQVVNKTSQHEQQTTIFCNDNWRRLCFKLPSYFADVLFWFNEISKILQHPWVNTSWICVLFFWLKSLSKQIKLQINPSPCDHWPALHERLTFYWKLSKDTCNQLVQRLKNMVKTGQTLKKPSSTGKVNVLVSDYSIAQMTPDNNAFWINHCFIPRE